MSGVVPLLNSINIGNCSALFSLTSKPLRNRSLKTLGLGERRRTKQKDRIHYLLKLKICTLSNCLGLNDFL
jgi:hypothetical protein